MNMAGKKKDDKFIRKKKDYSSFEKKKKLLNDSFVNSDNFSKSISSINERRDMFDLDRTRSKRRIGAALNCMDQALGLYEKYCPCIDGVFYPEEDYAECVSFPIPGYDTLDSDYYLLIGAAVWIINELKRTKSLYKAVDLLPEVPFEEGIYIPFDDVGCSYDVMEAFIYVLMHRNDDCSGYRSKNDADRHIADELTAQNKQHQDVPSRRLYEEILNFIPEERRRQADEMFYEKAEEAFIIYLKCRHSQAVKQDRLTTQADRLIERLEIQTKNAKAEFHGRQVRSGTPVMHSVDNVQRTVDAILKDHESLDNCYDQLDELHQDAGLVQYHFFSVLGEEQDKIGDEFGSKGKELVSSFSISNPTAMCFAMLDLLDRGDDLPWLYFPCIAIMQRTGQTLPWYGDEYDGINPIIAWEEGDPELKEFPNMDACRYHKIDPDDPDYRPRMSLNQILFECCGSIFPGNIDRYGNIAESLNQYDLNLSERQLILTAAIVILTSDFELEDTTWTSSQDISDNKSEDDTKEKDQAKIIADQKQELEALRTTAHRLQCACSDLNRRYQTLEKEYKADQQELGELRELIFNQENDIRENVSSGIQFPYTIQKETVVFGGHPTWLKEIKPLLNGNIRFMEAPDHFDENIIRNADTVWIQNNAISHSVYYRIMNTARSYHIPVHYLAFSSARKCAEQIMNKDK